MRYTLDGVVMSKGKARPIARKERRPRLVLPDEHLASQTEKSLALQPGIAPQVQKLCAKQAAEKVQNLWMWYGQGNLSDLDTCALLFPTSADGISSRNLQKQLCINCEDWTKAVHTFLQYKNDIDVGEYLTYLGYQRIKLFCTQWHAQGLLPWHTEGEVPRLCYKEENNSGKCRWPHDTYDESTPDWVRHFVTIWSEKVFAWEMRSESRRLPEGKSRCYEIGPFGYAADAQLLPGDELVVIECGKRGDCLYFSLAFELARAGLDTAYFDFADDRELIRHTREKLADFIDANWNTLNENEVFATQCGILSDISECRREFPRMAAELKKGLDFKQAFVRSVRYPIGDYNGFVNVAGDQGTGIILLLFVLLYPELQITLYSNRGNIDIAHYSGNSDIGLTEIKIYHTVTVGKSQDNFAQEGHFQSVLQARDWWRFAEHWQNCKAYREAKARH